MYEQIRHWCFNFEIANTVFAQFSIFSRSALVQISKFFLHRGIRNAYNVSHYNPNVNRIREPFAIKREKYLFFLDFSPPICKKSYSIANVVQTPRLYSAILNWIIIVNYYYVNVIREHSAFTTLCRESENTLCRTVAAPIPRGLLRF